MYNLGRNMDTNKKKENIISSHITFYEFSVLFLKSKYGRISLKSYGTYQNRIKIINEYFGNYRVSDITKQNLLNFEKYLKETRRWKYTFGVSDYSIKMIMLTLNELLSLAVKWSLIKDNQNSTCKKSKIKIINNIQLENEKRRVSKKFDEILYNIK